jgi:hypothetical protein
MDYNELVMTLTSNTRSFCISDQTALNSFGLLKLSFITNLKNIYFKVLLDWWFDL